ncbi:hypothetical protein KSS87_011456 [Heliosperma pusillum]|nr:hypothetical protein KSS87_011456 [Heliosperma pusillum]
MVHLCFLPTVEFPTTIYASCTAELGRLGHNTTPIRADHRDGPQITSTSMSRIDDWAGPSLVIEPLFFFTQTTGLGPTLLSRYVIHRDVNGTGLGGYRLHPTHLGAGVGNDMMGGGARMATGNPQLHLIRLVEFEDELEKDMLSWNDDRRRWVFNLRMEETNWVIHDYTWDLCGNDGVNSVSLEGLLNGVRSNLVVLFSPICRNFKGSCEYMGDDDTIDKWNDDGDGFCDEFRRVFGYVRDGFVRRDIHFSWVDVRYETGNDVGSQSWKLDDEYSRLLVLFRNGVKGLGWGFCSSDSIVLGSALVPFGLIYPMIGVPSSVYCDVGYDKCKKISLNLEISDVSGKPLECKYCDLQLVDPKVLSRRRLNELSLSWEPEKAGGKICQIGESCEPLGNEVVKIDVKALYQHSELVNFEGQIYDMVLVQELLIEPKRNKEESSRESYTDRVLDLLSSESGKSVKAKSPPLWQILLSFLYRRGYWALVSLSTADGSITMSILKPFTVNYALLCIPKNNAASQYNAQLGLNSLTLGQCSSDPKEKINGLEVGIGSGSGIVNDSRRKHRKHSLKYKDLSWSAFCKAAFEHFEMELEEACFFGGHETSKKMKFLKCWMKQIVKNSSTFQCKFDLLKGQEKSDERLCESQLESGQPLALQVGVNENNEVSHREEVKPSTSEAAEAFFGNLSQRIQHGIESGVDLLAFAQRVVHSCIYWISQKSGPHVNENGEASLELSSDSYSRGTLVGEVIKILLVEPKSISGKHKENDLSRKAPDSNSSEISSDNKIREYELQILFRMEILQSEFAAGIRAITKRKLVKQVCSLLELIQCSMEDGFFGNFNLSDYVGKIICDRYKPNLADIVHRIYEQMDLLLFDDEDESPNLLLNSEESNQSWKVGNSDQGSEANSTEDSFSGTSKDNEQTQRETRHERKLVEAQERRERALRLSSFNRRSMPELQRVWAPKPPKQSKSKSEYSRRCKRKTRRESYDMVCETPMSGAKKLVFPSECSVGDQDDTFTGTTKRVLFQDDPFLPDASGSKL